FLPHFWLSTEWFAPEDAPGIALPFYLAHPRLMALERRKIFEVEGGSEKRCLKLLRHEAGHAIDTAYALHRRKSYRAHFGNPDKPYPRSYTPKPNSRRFVLHLDLWYAQAHPVEDFAETFAVWLTYPKRWRSRYEGWPALKKLEYMDELMQEVRDCPPVSRSRKQIEPLSRLKTTLREHYERKCDRFGIEDEAFYDQELRRLFSEPASEAESSLPSISAAAFLRKHRRELRLTVSNWSGEWAFTVDQMLSQMIGRAKELHLRARGDQEALLRNTVAMLSVQATNRLLSSSKGVTL
ncbi:MAG: putative zinc-binding metallopeptidase, partial [Bdellovibrionales bacterium]|nr:putative zinc-binding metallopeptidase [Bdellovibrionales bacterium]